MFFSYTDFLGKFMNRTQKLSRNDIRTYPLVLLLLGSCCWAGLFSRFIFPQSVLDDLLVLSAVVVESLQQVPVVQELSIENTVFAENVSRNSVTVQHRRLVACPCHSAYDISSFFLGTALLDGMRSSLRERRPRLL